MKKKTAAVVPTYCEIKTPGSVTERERERSMEIRIIKLTRANNYC